VLAPVSKLSPQQAMYHFISGYTAKVAGTEMGVTEPQATFSACFGAAFMVWHPSKYAELLAKKMLEQGTKVWLVNTGWIGGGYGVGKRISLRHTRSIITAIQTNELNDSPTEKDSIFGFDVVTNVPDVPEIILQPSKSWKDPEAYRNKALDLARMFKKNFKQYESGSQDEIISAGPLI
jgi:phosphoenolpyruvate carboxykinase (ATP)